MLPAILLRIKVLFHFFFYTKQKYIVSPEPWLIQDKCTFFTQHSHIELRTQVDIDISIGLEFTFDSVYCTWKNIVKHFQWMRVRCVYLNKKKLDKILCAEVHRHMENTFLFPFPSFWMFVTTVIVSVCDDK